VHGDWRGVERGAARQRTAPPAEHGDPQQRALLKPGPALLILVLAFAVGCGAPARSSVDERPQLSELRPTASGPQLPILRAMSFSHHAEPRNQLVFEGGEPGGFTDLRLLTADDTLVAAGTSVPNTGNRLCADPRTAQPSPTESTRVTVDLGSQELLHDVTQHPERYRVELLTSGLGWRPVPFRFECHAEE
jgi:hypothetical protein